MCACVVAVLLQVMMEVLFMQQRELLGREAMDKDEKIGMLSRGEAAPVPRHAMVATD